MTITVISNRLSYGDITTCRQRLPGNPVVIHACKEPCHRHAVGYSDKSLAAHHPAYLALEKPGHLYLNMIDPPVPLFQIASFHTLLEFTACAGDRPIHIHCNQGQSRAPSLAILLMAKQMSLLPNTGYGAARQAFESRYPYTPGKGIASFLADNWNDIDL
ncbi:MAG: hypothetical protein WC807_20860 [Hyphomicrobium sp.]|jgi:hypothetical protein